MSFLDPLGIEELKKKKTNIFDLSGGFSTQSTQSPQAPTSAPRDQYMTPVPKATQPATQFSYSPVPNYSEGVVSPAAKNIFEAQNFKTQFNEEAENPYTPAAKAMQQLKFDRQAEYQKGITVGIEDLLTGMPEDQLPVLYSDIEEKDRQSMIDLAADMKSGMPIDKIYEFYPELSYTVKNYINDKYGKTFTEAIGLDKARQRLTDNSGGDSAWNFMKPITEGLADVFYGLAKGAENISQGSLGALNNAQGNLTPKKLNQNLLQLGQGASASAFTVLFPNATKVFSIAAQTPVINNITNAMGFVNDGIGRIGNYAPGLADFRNSFDTEEEKKQFDALIGSVITFGLMKSAEIKSGPIGNMNKFVQSKISSAVSPLSKLVNDYLKSKYPYETAKPAPGSASARYADFVKYAASRGYNVPKGQEPQGYQNFQKTFKGEGEPQQSYTAPEATVQEPVNPSSPFNQGYDSQGQATVKPQPQRNSKIDDMIMKTIAPSVRNIKTAPQLDMFKQKTFGGLQTILANREATPYLFDPEGNIDYNNTTLSNASQATNDAMFDVWNTQIKPMIDEATIAGATVDSTPMVTAIMDTVKGFKLSDGTVIPGMETAYQNMMKWINIFMDQEGNLKKINLDDAQIISQSLNKQAKPLYQGSSAGDIITLFAIDGLNKILRPLLDEAVEKFAGVIGLSEGKKLYGELANMQPYLTKRGIVADRQKPVGLFEGLGDIYSGTEIAGAIGKLVTADFGGFVISIARAGASKFIGKLLKQTNNNNRMFADLLKEIDKQTNGFRYKGGIKNISRPKAPWQAKYYDTQGLPATAEPTVIGPKGPQVNVPNTPERTIPVQKTIRETYGPNYDNPVDKKNAEVKKSLLKKKEVEDAARESVKQNQESERLAKMEARDKQAIADFEKAKNNGYQLSDSNDWKSGDVSKLGTLDKGVTIDGTMRIVTIDGIKYPESMARPVYREKREIEQRNFGDMKNQWIIDGLEVLDVKSMNDLPKEFQDRLLEIANQGARGDMGKLADKINVLVDDWKNYKNNDGQTEKKEYNSTKKSLLSKKDSNDGSKLQTEQGSIVGQSNRDEQISSIISKDKNESMTERTDTGIQLNGGYTSDNAGIGDGYGAGSTLSKSKQSELNQRVISLIESKNFSTDPKDYTPEQIQDMLKYEGGGGLSKKEGDTSGSNDEFYTPENVINVMRDIAKKYGFKEYAEVLEPSAGVGRFLRNKPEWIGRSTGMEIDKISGTIAKITNPESKIVIGDFQDQFMDFTKTKPLSQLEIKDLPKFDVVIGNPPYKERTTRQRNLGDLKEVNRFEDYFMIRGIDRLKNGGTMVVIVPSAFLDKGLYSAKQLISDKGGILVDAYRLPNKTFPNTDVGTDILVFKKTGSILESTAESNKYLMADGERFKNNPSKILGEVGERTNRFGKMEKFVKGDASNLSKIMGSEPKPKTTIENKPVELGPLTITNLVTGKQEILDVPAPALPTKDMGGIQRQVSEKNTVGNITNTIYDIIESNGGLKDGYIKVESEGFMPLSIEKIGNREIAVSHTYIQNGDLMRDPEIVFKVTTFGELSAQTIQNDPYPPHTISALDDFLDMRADNLRDQGFIKRAMKTAEEQKSEMLNTEKELLIRDRKELDKLQNYTKQFPGTKKPQIIKTLEDTIATREKMIEMLDNKATDIVESKKTLIAKKTTETVKEPVKQNIVAKPQQIKPSQATSKSLFDMPTEKQIDVIAEKIVNPVIEKLPDGVSNRMIGGTSLDPVDAQKLLQYQKITNALGEVQGVDFESDPKLLNYMDGDVYVNYNYFSGDIYGKLDQLEIDKPKMNEMQYQKQREGLLEVLPTPQTLENMSFSVTRNDIMNIKLPELKTVVDYKYDPKTERNIRTESQVPMTIKDGFKSWLREEGVPSRARVGSSEIISYFEGGRIKSERKGMVMEDANRYFDKFIKDVLDSEIQEAIVRKENIENRNIANIDVSKVPFILENVSKTFRGSNLNFKEEQNNTAIKAAMKGSYIISLGAGHGKTMVGINAVVWNMQNGFTKRPLIIVPKQTMRGREETIRGLYPTYKLNVLGSLDSAERARQYKLRGKDTSKWIGDNTITLMTHEAYVGQLSFTDDTINRVLSELGDDMKVEGATSKKTEADIEKTEADISAVAIGKVKKNNVNMSMFDSERSAQQYNNLQKMTHEEFIAQFIEDTEVNKNARYKDMSRQELTNKANEMLSIEPMYVEKMGFDMICFDELQNAKNIFSKATIQDVDGKKGNNMFGDIVGATSIIGKKTMIGANYMQYINNGRGFIGLTATPFNNQAIEVYNNMVLVGRARLKKMGINNMNDFMSRFSEFTEELVVGASGIGYKSIQKGFANLQSMQKLINEHIRWVGDDPAIIKPELVHKYITLQMSPLQEELQKQIELDMVDKTRPGAMIAGISNARVNNVSPYFTSMGRSMSFTPEELLKNSPKLDLFADVVIEQRKMGNKDVAIMFIPFGKELHGMLAEGISKKTGVPLSRIGIINSIPKYKKAMFETIDKAQNGELDILIGGKTINEGVDIQKRGYIVYDVMMGFNPTEPVQKIARTRRQGNLRSHVVAIHPAIENSIDSFMFQKVEEKMARINDIFSGEGEVFDTTENPPGEEKLNLITDPEKKAKVYIEIEQRKMQRNIELIRGELNDLERWKADLVQEINTLPNLIANLERYKSYPGDYTSYINTIKKDIDSIKRKAKTARENIEKRGINLDADIQIKLRELESINEEARNLSATMPDKIAEYIQEQKTVIANRRTRQSYLDEINEITKNLKVFETQDQQAVFKKSLLGKK